jgi:hypothetical protein
MLRIVVAAALSICVIVSSPCSFGQTRDRRLEEATSDITLLKRVVKEQDRRIAELEKTVKSLQAAAANAPPPVAPEPPRIARKPLRPVPWHVPSSWTQIRPGMSRAEVEEILGPPTLADSVIDHQTLTYKGDVPGLGPRSGTVKLTDDRVSDVDPPEL